MAVDLIILTTYTIVEDIQGYAVDLVPNMEQPVVITGVSAEVLSSIAAMDFLNANMFGT